jgi:hypothetical protein
MAEEKFLPCSLCASGGLCSSCVDSYGDTADCFNCCVSAKNKTLCGRCYFQCHFCEQEMCVRHRRPKLRIQSEGVCLLCFYKPDNQEEIAAAKERKKRRRMKK